MKPLENRWYFVTYLFNENSESKEYSIYSYGISATHAAVKGTTALYQTHKNIQNIELVDIRSATLHEYRTLNDECKLI